MHGSWAAICKTIEHLYRLQTQSKQLCRVYVYVRHTYGKTSPGRQAALIITPWHSTIMSCTLRVQSLAANTHNDCIVCPSVTMATLCSGYYTGHIARVIGTVQYIHTYHRSEWRITTDMTRNVAETKTTSFPRGPTLY